MKAFYNYYHFFSLTKVYNSINRILREVPLFFVIMKNLLLVCSVLFSILITGQEKREIISGKVNYHSTPISDMHVVNKTSNQGTITNDVGFFEILGSIGDTLAFSHINLEIQEMVITKRILSESKIEINLQEKTYALEEIIFEKPRSIFYVDPEIMPQPTVNATTLNLPYTNTKAKKNYPILKINSGATVNLDNLINSINGAYKRRKELQKITLEDAVLSKIRKQYTDDFFITDLHIKQEDINQFLNYCYKKNVIYHFNQKENLKLTRILMNESKTFPQRNTTKVSILH